MGFGSGLGLSPYQRQHPFLISLAPVDSEGSISSHDRPRPKNFRAAGALGRSPGKIPTTGASRGERTLEARTRPIRCPSSAPYLSPDAPARSFRALAIDIPIAKVPSFRRAYGAFHPPSRITPIGARPMLVVNHHSYTTYAFRPRSCLAYLLQCQSSQDDLTRRSYFAQGKASDRAASGRDRRATPCQRLEHETPRPFGLGSSLLRKRRAVDRRRGARAAPERRSRRSPGHRDRFR